MTKVLTDQMKVFINENIDEEKKKKVEENDYELFYKLITEYIYERARDLSKVLKLNYVGVKKEDVAEWIEEFFETFDERIKKAKESKEKKAQKTKKRTSKKNIELDVTEGLFGSEITYKKKTYTKPEFIEQLKKELKEDYELIWEDRKVTINFNVKKPEPKPEKEKETENIEEKEEEKTENIEEKEEEKTENIEENETEETEEELEEEPKEESFSLF
jgi:hypothetical protein